MTGKPLWGLFKTNFASIEIHRMSLKDCIEFKEDRLIWKIEITSFDDLVYAQPNYISNVEKGLAYMVGIYSKVIPYETCHTVNRSQIIPCEVENPYW